MATAFPAGRDNFTNPAGTDSMDSPSHAGQHADANDAIEAIEAFLIDSPVSQSADYTLTLTDLGKVVELDSATAVTVTVPPASSVAFPVGAVVYLYQVGAGNVSVAAGSGVTVRNLSALRGQHAEASLRYRGSDEWVLAGDLATAAGSTLVDYAEVLRTSGDLTLSSTSVSAVSSALDLTLAASEGDLVEFGMMGLLAGSVNPSIGFDVYTLPSGSPVNPFSVGLSTALATAQGVPGWECPTNQTDRLQGSITRVLTSGDVSGGSTVLRLFYAKYEPTNARILYANSNIPLKVWAKNYGQV